MLSVSTYCLKQRLMRGDILLTQIEDRKVITKTKKRKMCDYDYDNKAGYMFIAPWLTGFIIFTIIPMLASLYFSFTRYDVLSAPKWIGVENYISMLIDDRFWQALKVTFFYAVVHVPLKLAFALVVAMLFAQKRKMIGFYRTLFYVPSIIGGSVAVAVMWRQLFGMDGALNSILIKIGVMDKGIGWLGNPNTAIWTIILLAIWQFGSPMLIFLSGLKQIPESLYEAAEIDGANSFQRFFSITLPMLSPIIFFNFIMQSISGFMAFNESYIITQGGPFDRTLFYALYLFQKAFQFYDMGYGCALAWVLLVIIGILTALIFKSSSYWVFYESEGKW